MNDFLKTYARGLVAGAGILTVFLLAFALCFAADILTIDRDGVIRFRVSDKGEVAVNPAADAAQPALRFENVSVSKGDIGLNPRSSDPSSSSAGEIWYNSSDSSAKIYDGTTAFPLPGKLRRYAVEKSDGDFGTTSTSFVNVPGLSLNVTTDYPNQTILIAFTGKCMSDSASGGTLADVTLDGVSLSGSTEGLTSLRSYAAWAGGNISFSFFHTVATSGNHTIQLQTKSNNGSYTAYLRASAASSKSYLSVIKLF